MSKPRVTIKDLAKELKISTSTVSRALCDKWDVNPETRKAVLELAEKWNYKPNPISLSLKQSQSMFIGVIVPEFVNSFFSEALEAQMVDGFLISVTQESENTSYFSDLIWNNFPVVFFNRICAELSAPHVVIDDYKWAFAAVEHLIQQGCRRIVHLAGSEDLLIAQKRKNGYMDALRKYGLLVEESLIIDCGIMMEKGIMAAHQILEMEKMPDGIFAVNDPVAIGAMKTLQKNKIRIPEDMAVVGFSESKEAFIVEPNLTSVGQPTFEMGRNAAQLLLEQIKHNVNNEDKMLSKSIILDAKSNIRESSLRRTS